MIGIIGTQMMLKTLKHSFALFTATVLLFLSFFTNFFHTAEQSWFDDFQFDSDSLVYGRLVESQNHGITSYEGVLGRLGLTQDFKNQKKIFINGSDQDMKFYPYASQVGIQGGFFSAINNVLNKYSLSTALKVSVFNGISSLLLALILSFISLFFLSEFGFVSWLLTITSIILSQWLVVMGKSLYWSFWLFYIPFAISLWAHKSEWNKGKFNSVFFGLICLFVFIKCLAGYEYISSILLSIVIPVIYFSILNCWSKNKVIFRVLKLGISGLSGFVLAFIYQVYIIANLRNISVSKSLKDIFQHSANRMYAEKGTFGSGGWEDGVNASVFQVLDSYWRGEAINFHSSLGVNNFYSISFGEMVLVFMIFTSMIFWSKTYSENIELKRRKLFSFAAMLWFSILCPLSWFTLAKVHSYVHTHINHVLWSFPFLLIGFSFIGYLISLIWHDVKYKFNLSKKADVILAIFTLSLLTTSFLMSKHNFKERLTEIKRGVLISRGVLGYIDIYLLKDNNLGYLVNNCSKIDLSVNFFLHFYPVNPVGINGLNFGFENHDFKWNDNSDNTTMYSKYADVCYKVLALPDFKIKMISTGQFNDNGRLWQVDYLLNERK